MKNKHIVLLFLAILAIGLVARRVPWRETRLFQTKLIELDSADVREISITLPDQPELLIERTDEGWAATQFNRAAAVSPPDIAPLLAALAEIRSLRIVKTKRPDTLGLGPAEALQLTATLADGHKESFKIGKETLEDTHAATYLELPEHDGIYLVQRHLRSIFFKKVDDFRENIVARFDLEAVQGFSIFLEKNDTVFFQKNDSTGRWETREQSLTISQDSVNTWLYLFYRLNSLPFADLFDESHAADILVAHIDFDIAGQTEPLTLKFFSFGPTEYAGGTSKTHAR